MPDTAPITNPFIFCLKKNIVDFLDYQLSHDLITEKRAGQLARSTLDRLRDVLTPDQIHTVCTDMMTDFPELAKDLESAYSACETQAARQAIDQEILEAIGQGNIDTALAKLDTFKIK